MVACQSVRHRTDFASGLFIVVEGNAIGQNHDIQTIKLLLESQKAMRVELASEIKFINEQ